MYYIEVDIKPQYRKLFDDVFFYVVMALLLFILYQLTDSKTGGNIFASGTSIFEFIVHLVLALLIYHLLIMEIIHINIDPTIASG